MRRYRRGSQKFLRMRFQFHRQKQNSAGRGRAAGFFLAPVEAEGEGGVHGLVGEQRRGARLRASPAEARSSAALANGCASGQATGA